MAKITQNGRHTMNRHPSHAVRGVVAFLAGLALFACGGGDGGPGGSCPAAPSAGEDDSDGDGVDDSADLCPGYDDALDADADGVPDGCDLCEGADDADDADGDGLPDACDPEPEKADWLRTATVGGAAMWWEAGRLEIEAILNELKDQGVTVVEADSDLSLYLDDDQFQRELDLIEATSILAHDRGMKVVWYYPTLEVVTNDGRISDVSMFKDNPGWVQRSIDGSPNVFYGDVAFWVPPDAESAWMDPLTPYREYYLERIRKLAATGVDGLWLDVPLFNDIVGVWPTHTPEARAAFLAETGHEPPTAADPDDPVWWIWIDWRARVIADFLDEIHREAREISPDFRIIIENVTLDYNSSLLQGLDGTFSPGRDGFTFVWEVDVTSESDGMIFASPDDWIAMVAMMKFGRGVTPGKPSWSFTYGNVVDDAEMVMAEALATQNNPYELKAPEMTTTVGHNYRQRMFTWIQEHKDLLFRAESAARIAVVQSSASRNFVDGSCMVTGECGLGLYASTERPAELREEATWWAYSELDSLYTTRYMAEYRGMAKALIHLHRPFDVVPLRNARLEQLRKYSAVIVPDLQAVSFAEAALLVDYVEGGGHALFTGPAPGARDELAAVVPTNPLAALIDPALTGADCADRVVGSGRVTQCPDRVGKAYFVDGDAAARATIDAFLTGAGTAALQTDAPDNVHFELYRRNGRLAVHAVNFTGTGGKVRVAPTSFTLALDASELDSVCRVVAHSPRTGTRILPHRYVDGRVEVDVDLDLYQVIVFGP